MRITSKSLAVVAAPLLLAAALAGCQRTAYDSATAYRDNPNVGTNVDPNRHNAVNGNANGPASLTSPVQPGNPNYPRPGEMR